MYILRQTSPLPLSKLCERPGQLQNLISHVVKEDPYLESPPATIAFGPTRLQGQFEKGVRLDCLAAGFCTSIALNATTCSITRPVQVLAHESEKLRKGSGDEFLRCCSKQQRIWPGIVLQLDTNCYQGCNLGRVGICPSSSYKMVYYGNYE